MKLRLHENRVRFRLLKREVEQLAAGERIEHTTSFSAASKLVWRLEAAAGQESPVARFEAYCLVVILPLAQARRWATSDQVGIEFTQATGDGAPLVVAIEKDFRCLHTAAADEADVYPNPTESSPPR